MNWVDTDRYRAYELANHSAVVFPYLWDERRHHIILIAGFVSRRGERLLTPGFSYAPYPVADYFNKTLELNSSPEISGIGYAGYHLLMSRQMAIDFALSAKHRVGALQTANSIRVFPSDLVELQLFFQDDHLSVIEIIEPLGKMPLLDHYLLGIDSLPIDSQGYFRVRLGPETMEPETVSDTVSVHWLPPY